MIQMYWGVGHVILERQAKEGWGAKVIDRLSADLRAAFPEMKGLSPRNLKYMRAFTAAWPDLAIVQERLHQLTWYHQLALLEKLPDQKTRLWYAERTLKHGWSRNILAIQIERRIHERQGKAIANFAQTLPPIEATGVQLVENGNHGEYRPRPGADFPIPMTVQINAPTQKPFSDGPDYQKSWRAEGLLP
jgi:predicted nuclease of restriction endonuclease-like (RecB) superfamily